MSNYDDDTARLSAPARWHRALSRVVGALSLAIGRRKLSRNDLDEWSIKIGEVKAEIDEMRGR